MPLQSECVKYNLKSQCPKVQEIILKYKPDLRNVGIEADKLCASCEYHLEWLRQHR